MIGKRLRAIAISYLPILLSRKLKKKPEPRRYASFAHGPEDELIYCPPCTFEEGEAAWDKEIREETERSG